MQDTLKVSYQNGAGGLVHTVVGELQASTVIAPNTPQSHYLALVGLPDPAARQDPRFPPLLVLANPRQSTRGLDSRTKLLGIAFDRIVTVEWIGDADA